jgi:Family of unknown function (DUF6390)
VTGTAGPLLFARYAYPPNALGLCGADAPRTLLEYGDAQASDGGLAELARTFEGAWPYLTLIAGANGIADPLDPRVVDAYWVGNDLLERVDPAALAHHVDARFRGRLGSAKERVRAAVAVGAQAHHCFHVFVVYPWIGLLRSGMVDEPLHVLDQCRTTSARVLEVEGSEARVLARPLQWEAGALRLGAPANRCVRWQDDGLRFVGLLEPGSLVALHWDFVCDVLSDRRASALERATQHALRAANAALGAPSAEVREPVRCHPRAAAGGPRPR